MNHNPPHPIGADHPKWKGGTTVNKDGYLQISAGPLRGTYVHTLVAQAKIGRELSPAEEVHHIDRNRLNAHPDNLQVLTAGEHDALCSSFKRRRHLKRRVVKGAGVGVRA